MAEKTTKSVRAARAKGEKEMKCKKCGHEHFYLKEEGMHIGAYCENCEAWITWISKKDLPLAEKHAVRFIKGLHIDEIETSNIKIENAVRGVIPPPASQDPKGPQGPRRILPSSATAEQLVNELKYYTGEAQKVFEELGNIYEKINYYSKLVEEKLKGNEDDTPPWD